MLKSDLKSTIRLSSNLTPILQFALDLPTSQSRIASGEAASREIDLSPLQEFGSD